MPFDDTLPGASSFAPDVYGPASIRTHVRTHVKETIATLREVVLMPRALTPSIPTDLTAEDDVVVLLHGFFASAGVFGPMSRHLVEDTGAKLASFTHAPGMGVARIARSLAKVVDRIPHACRVHLVGHSLGGIVARWYVQELGGHRRVAQTVSLGSPFGGTERAHPFPILVGAELGRSSPLLARLRERAHEHDVPHTSIVGTADVMVAPRESAIFPRGEVIVLRGRGHNTLLFDPESIGHVVTAVRRRQPAHTT